MDSELAIILARLKNNFLLVILTIRHLWKGSFLFLKVINTHSVNGFL